LKGQENKRGAEEGKVGCYWKDEKGTFFFLIHCYTDYQKS